MITEMKGKQFGVKLVQRGKNDPHICIQMLSEDDGNWLKQGPSFSSYWIDDLIDILSTAKKVLEDYPEDSDGYGRTFEVS